MSTNFPDDLLQQYKSLSTKLKKAEKAVFKRFGPNLLEVSEEFSSLAGSFNKAFLPEYAALCWLGVAKCEGLIGNGVTEVDALLRSAKAFLAAHDQQQRLHVLTNAGEHLEGALRCYNQALGRLSEDSAMRAAIIREIKKIKPNAENTSNFNSPSHRIYDLEMSAKESIQSGDFVAALEKLTEICDDVGERRVEAFYGSVLNRTEISRLLLLLLLEVPPARQSPSHIKLLERYTSLESSCSDPANIPIGMDLELFLQLQGLAVACQMKDIDAIRASRNAIIDFRAVAPEQHFVLGRILRKFEDSANVCKG
ncbi:40-kDa huntingtin-associated protein [Phlebotomus argentipes]|uniref:40-kDa huntingtin-associated protein n=1 Tax=Phlebotomus argentipes TaxID=94469 RepID=UPI002892F7A3|nr:40-kDa huntingtin-associated protein [Phlebotomus argentipes]